MPSYTVRDPQSGKTVTLTGDSPPTEKELNDIFAKINPQGAMGDAIQRAGLKNTLVGQLASPDKSFPVDTRTPGVEALTNKVPGQIAETLGKKGFPVAGAALGTAANLVGRALPKDALETEMQLSGEGLVKGAAEVGGAALKKVPSIVSAMTRIAPEFSERVASRTGQVVGALKRAGEKDILEPMVNKLKVIAEDARSAIGQRLGAIEQRVAQKYQDRMIPTADIGAHLENGLKTAGFDLPGATNVDVKVPLSKNTQEIINDFNNLQGGTKAIPPETSKLLGPSGQSIIKPGIPAKPARPTAMNFQSALNLRRKMDQTLEFIDSGSLQVGQKEQMFLKQARHQLNERLKSVDPLFKQANDKFAEVAQNFNSLRKELSSSDALATGRIERMFKKGTLERKVVDKLDKISQEAGNKLDEILDIVTAQKFNPRINPKIAVAATGTGGGIAGLAAKIGVLSNPIAAATGLAAAGAGTLASSPRAGLRAIQASKYLGDQTISGLPRIMAGQLAAKIPPSLAKFIKRQVSDANTPANP